MTVAQTPPVVVHYPYWAVGKADLPTISLFYTRLLQSLTAAGTSVEVRGQPGKPNDLSTRAGTVHVSYHTCLALPGVFNVKISYLPDFFYFDRTGYSGWAELARDPDMFTREEGAIDQAAADHAVAQVACSGRSKYSQPAAGYTHPRRYVFVALQVIDDTVAELAWLAGPRLCENVVARYAGTGIDVVIKRHPKCRSGTVKATLDRVAEQPHVTIADADINALVRGAEAVFTVNSGVGFEALLAEKPVIVSGDSDYALACYQLRNEGDFAELPLRPDPAMAPDRLRRFLYFYLYHYCLPVSDEAAFSRALFAKLPRTTGLARARRASRLRRLYLWVRARRRRRQAQG